MTAGLPGVGISGLFFVLSALLMPVIEIGRAITGRSSVERWRAVLRQSGMAWTIVLVIERTVWLITVVLQKLHAGANEVGAGGVEAAAADPATFAFPVAPVLIALVMLALVLAGAYLMHLMASGRRANQAPSLLRAPRQLTEPVRQET